MSRLVAVTPVPRITLARLHVRIYIYIHIYIRIRVVRIGGEPRALAASSI